MSASWQLYVILPWQGFSLPWSKQTNSTKKPWRYQKHSMATVAALNSLPLFSSATELPIPQQVNAERLLNPSWCLHSTGHPLILPTGCFCCILGVWGAEHPSLLMASRGTSQLPSLEIGQTEVEGTWITVKPLPSKFNTLINYVDIQLRWGLTDVRPGL